MTDPSASPEPTVEPPSPDPTPGPHRPTGAINLGPVQYKGQPLDSARGPGLGCFRFQLAILVVLIVATPLSVGRLPETVTVVLLFAMIGLLLVSGQTIIFLLRLISADRRGRRQPVAGRTPTVGQLEDAAEASPTEPERRRPTRRSRRPPMPSHPPTRDRRPRAPCDNSARLDAVEGGSSPVPVLATYFSVRRGRDPFFKFFMRTIFPKQVREYEEKFGIRFLGWYNVAHGWDFDNVILLDLPDYATLDKLEKRRSHPRPRAPGR